MAGGAQGIREAGQMGSRGTAQSETIACFGEEDLEAEAEEASINCGVLKESLPAHLPPALPLRSGFLQQT